MGLTVNYHRSQGYSQCNIDYWLEENLNTKLNDIDTPMVPEEKMQPNVKFEFNHGFLWRLLYQMIEPKVAFHKYASELEQFSNSKKLTVDMVKELL